MKTKTLSIKIPMTIMQQMIDKEQLFNPKWVSNFLIIATNEYYNDEFLPFSYELSEKGAFTYTYRADCFVINNVKKATKRMFNIPITTYTEILFRLYYDKLEKTVPYD